MGRIGIGALLLASGAICAVALVRWGSLGLTSNAPSLVPEQPYAVETSSEKASFELDFTAGSRYVVVVGSLGASTRQLGIDCSSPASAAVGSASLNCIHRVDRLGNASPPEFAANRLLHARRTPNSRLEIRQGDAVASGVKPVGFQQNAERQSGSRTFALHVTDGSLDDPAQYVTIHARGIADGRNVRVYLDDQQSTRELPPGLVRNVTDLFDREIIPRFRGVFGTCRDVDRDGRFAVLLSPWLGRLQGGRTSVGGFVRGSDFQPRWNLPFSNHCDMMYVNSGTLPGPHLRSLLIHEYTHAVCFSHRTSDAHGQPRFPEEEDWLNEAIAHCAESLFGGGWTNLDYRIARFLNTPAAYPLVVDDYYRAGLWRCHGCRGATYLFLRHCVEQFGPEVLTRIISNPARGTRNLEMATGYSFDRLFRDWTVSLIEASAERPVATEAIVQPLAPLNLFGSLGTWGLAGPHRQIWDVDAAPLRFDLKGTAATYLELCASRTSGARRIQIQAPKGTRLQVTIMKLAAGSPHVDVAASWATNSSSELPMHLPTNAVDRAQTDRLRVVVRWPRGDDFTLEQIAAEQNTDEIRESVRFSQESLPCLESSSNEAASRSIADAQIADAAHCRTFELPAASLTARDIPVVVKVVGIDRRGRRVSAWATVDRNIAAPTADRLAQGHL